MSFENIVIRVQNISKSIARPGSGQCFTVHPIDKSILSGIPRIIK
jgi:hypothetical protein